MIAGQPDNSNADMDDLSAMENQLVKPREEERPKPKVGAVSAVPKTERRPRKTAKETTEEAAARVSLARANARTIVSTIEGAKKITAEQIFGLSWDGAKITGEEERDLIECLTRYLDSVGWDLSNPKVGLVVLVLTEARITLRQYATLKGMLPQEGKDAVAKP